MARTDLAEDQVRIPTRYVLGLEIYPAGNPDSNCSC